MPPTRGTSGGKAGLVGLLNDGGADVNESFTVGSWLVWTSACVSRVGLLNVASPWWLLMINSFPSIGRMLVFGTELLSHGSESWDGCLGLETTSLFGGAQLLCLLFSQLLDRSSNVALLLSLEMHLAETAIEPFFLTPTPSSFYWCGGIL